MRADQKRLSQNLGMVTTFGTFFCCAPIVHFCRNKKTKKERKKESKQASVRERERERVREKGNKK